MKRTLIADFAALPMPGCASLGHREFYTQVAPTNLMTRAGDALYLPGMPSKLRKGHL
jgi:hypothetical protein